MGSTVDCMNNRCSMTIEIAKLRAFLETLFALCDMGSAVDCINDRCSITIGIAKVWAFFETSFVCMRHGQ